MFHVEHSGKISFQSQRGIYLLRCLWFDRLLAELLLMRCAVWAVSRLFLHMLLILLDQLRRGLAAASKPPMERRARHSVCRRASPGAADVIKSAPFCNAVRRDEARRQARMPGPTLGIFVAMAEYVNIKVSDG